VWKKDRPIRKRMKYIIYKLRARRERGRGDVPENRNARPGGPRRKPATPVTGREWCDEGGFLRGKKKNKYIFFALTSNGARPAPYVGRQWHSEDVFRASSPSAVPRVDDYDDFALLSYTSVLYYLRVIIYIYMLYTWNRPSDARR